MTTAPHDVTLDWHTDLNDAPADTGPAPHPYRTRAWAAAWQRQDTERILTHRHATVTDPATGVRETISFLLIEAGGSPYWNSQEADAALSAPVWPGPVLWAGSPHAEYGGAGTATTSNTRTVLAAGHQLARELGACALALPGLDPAQAARVTRAGGPDILNVATDVALTRPLGADHDAWWTPMLRRHRIEARRQWKRGTEEGLTLQVHHGPAALPDLRTFHTLAERTAQRHGSSLYGADMLRHLADTPGAVLLGAHSGGQFVGGLYGWLHNRCLYMWAAGVDYHHRLGHRAYTWLMGEIPRWALTNNATHIDAGRWNCAAKTRLGYRPTVLRTAVLLTEPDPGTTERLRHLSAELGTAAAPFLGDNDLW